MMIWLDYFCRMHSNDYVLPEERLGDPRRDLAYFIWRRVDKFYDTGREMPQDADYLWFSMLFPFTLPYLTTGPAKPQLVLPSQPLGLLLTRPTAALLANASPPVGDAYWIAELGDRVVYIDVPHGAVTIAESFQLRALFARRLQSDQNDRIMMIGLVADRGSERAHGRMFALLERDGRVIPALDEKLRPMTHLGPRSPFNLDPASEPVARERAADFLRLALAYYFFGPKEARQPILVTPTIRLNAGKPRKEESLFAMVRLQPARDRLGRPDATISTNWSLTARQEVSGHFKLQPHGAGGSLRKLIWVAAYDRGPDNAPIKPKAYRI